MKRRLVSLPLLLLATACGSGGSGTTLIVSPLAPPEVHVLDVNPNSPTSGELVSPRQKLGMVSAWYFGHAT